MAAGICAITPRRSQARRRPRASRYSLGEQRPEDGLVGRFLLDPFRQSRWSGYGGAGLSALHTEHDWRGYMLAVVGVEGPGGRRFLPALEIGLGGGTRIGLVLRNSPLDRR